MAKQLEGQPEVTFVPAGLLPLVRVVRDMLWDLGYSPIHPQLMELLCTDLELLAVLQKIAFRLLGGRSAPPGGNTCIDREGLEQVFQMFLQDITQVIEGIEQEDETTFGVNVQHARLLAMVEQARREGQTRVEGLLSYLLIPVLKEPRTSGAPVYWIELNLHADL